MKLGGKGSQMRLGGGAPAGGVQREVVTLPQRPDVIADDGTVYEVVWFPHAAAPSLLGDEVSRPSTLTAVCPVAIVPEDRNQKDRWSWLG